MGDLVLIHGAFGRSKSRILNFVQSDPQNYGFPEKNMTSLRDRENWVHPEFSPDITWLNLDDFEESLAEVECYEYELDGFRYAIPTDGIKRSLLAQKITFVIANDIDCIKSIRSDFSNHNAVSIYIHTDERVLRTQYENHQNKHGDKMSNKEISFRLKRHTNGWKQYLEHGNLFDRVLIYSEAPEEYEKQIKWLINKENSNA